MFANLNNLQTKNYFKEYLGSATACRDRRLVALGPLSLFGLVYHRGQIYFSVAYRFCFGELFSVIKYRNFTAQIPVEIICCNVLAAGVFLWESMNISDTFYRCCVGIYYCKVIKLCSMSEFRLQW